MTRSNPFDVIICDYNMPDIDGLETIRLIRNKLNLTHEKQPVILLHTSTDSPDLHHKCDELGIKFKLVKPVKRDDLFSYLSQVHQPKREAEKLKHEAEKPTVPAVATSLENSMKDTVKILIAEDNEINARLITIMLEKIIPEVEVIIVTNGCKVLEQLEKMQPDLILMDLHMPEMNGMEATQIIRKLEQQSGNRIPIIALTADVSKEDRVKCFNLGMDDFLTKPLTFKQIEVMLMKFLNHKVKSFGS